MGVIKKGYRRYIALGMTVVAGLMVHVSMYNARQEQIRIDYSLKLQRIDDDIEDILEFQIEAKLRDEELFEAIESLNDD